MTPAEKIDLNEYGGGGRRPPRFLQGRLGPRGTVIGIAAFLIVVVLAVSYMMFLEYVRPSEYGIKEIKIGVNRGIQEKVYSPGYALVVPFMQMMHRLPREVQVLELTDSPETAARFSSNVHHATRPAKIQTSDGFYVDVDASILYRIVDPYRVITGMGTGQEFLHKGIIPKAEPILKQALGTLTTEDFYNSPLRVERTEVARAMLDEEMERLGISVDQVLIRYFRYSDAIQENIEQKKLQDQLVFSNQSKGRAAEEELNLNRVTTEGEMQVTIAQEEGQAYRVLKEAERDLYTRKKSAEADLLVQLAEAKRTELRNAAMQEMGAERMVAMRMAGVLNGLEMIVIPSGGEGSLNPLDLGQMMDVFGGENVTAPEGELMQQAPPEAETEEVRRHFDEIVENAQRPTEELAPEPLNEAPTPDESAQTPAGENTEEAVQ